MDYLGSQVGQKMRSAVKAKLIELGTGGTTGYIDDELPDYVMIMVANKRSKQQMIADLSLFLDAHTELFVTWLHEVLQKLQEVTLPAAVVPNVKRKSTDMESSISNKKEKKEKKKGKKLKRSSEKLIESVSPSIPNVLVSELLQKAKSSVPIGAVTKNEITNDKNNTDEFDIPTITEISEQSAQKSREKELSELTELQKKIMQAKRQLKSLETDESEDEDFLSIKEDVEELDDIVGDKSVKKIKDNNNIACDVPKSNETGKENRNSSEGKNRKHVPIVYNSEVEKNTNDNGFYKKRSIHDRLGYKPVRKMDAGGDFGKSQRSEMEYDMSSRRKKDDKRTRNKSQNSKTDVGSNDDNSQNKCVRNTVRQRIGSRVIVAPPKPEYKDDDDSVDKSINSLIKVKPRPSVSPSKQASKNLLLRAVAEAQKSTALIRPRKECAYLASKNVSSSRIQKLYTKSHRDKNREALLKRAAKDNIVIEVNTDKEQLTGLANLQDDEYVPEPISDRGDSDNDYVYVPQIINSSGNTFDYDCKKKEEENNAHKTQFVVTLDDKSRDKYISKHKTRIVDQSLERIEIKTLPESASEWIDTNKESSSRKTISKGSTDSYPKSKETAIITEKNDADEKVLRKSLKTNPQMASTTLPSANQSISIKRKRSSVSPIKFNQSGKPDIKRKVRSEEKDKTKGEREKEDNKISTHTHKELKASEKISTKIPEIVRKYENIPELNAIPVDSSVIKSKSKERCKYFPTCGKGDSCEFHHPALPCKTFPACKFAEKCLYLHPKCKFDLTCNRIGCNFSHSIAVGTSVAPPLPSHVVPVQNYKTITATPMPAMCKYYPKCTNTMCNFYHPKLCRFGKNCMNKVECNFFHHDVPNKAKFKWVASSV